MYRLDRMRKQYEELTAAQGYIIGFEMNGIIYAVELNKIPRRYTKVQKECSKAGGGYGLYINVNTKKIKMQLMKKALTKGAVFPIVRSIAKWFGVRLTKSLFTGAIKKAIPVVGGVVGGGITFFAFKPCCYRLKDALKDTRLSNPEHKCTKEETEILDDIMSRKIIDADYEVVEDEN